MLRYGGGVGWVARKAQVVPVPPPTRCGVPEARNSVSIGGGQPGRAMNGAKNGVPICRPSNTAYDCFCVLSLIPPDWKPAVIELPIAT